jgi:prepilin-type N-terminal cleavage/methylation domain-containing protein
MKAIFKNRRGFTLLEIMITILLLTVALLGMAALTATVVKGNSYSKQVTTATMLAKDKMEQLKNTTVSSLTGGTDYATIDSTIQGSSTGAFYTRTWSITSGTTTTTVTVVVQWVWEGKARSTTISTIVAN